MFDKKVKAVRLYKNAIIRNQHHERNYLVKKYIEIEFVNGKVIKLNPIAGADFTDSDYLEVITKGKLVKNIYRSFIFDIARES